MSYQPSDTLIDTAQADPWDFSATELDDADPVTKSVVRAIERPPKPDWGEHHSAVPLGPNGEHLDLPPMKLPGFGDAYDDCDDDLPLFCECCGSTSITNRTCRRSQCPRCAPTWVRDRAESVCARLDATRRVLDAKREEHQRYHHLAFSPPDDWRTADPEVLDTTMHVIRDILESMGLEGFVFYHPYRIGNDEDPDADDRGRWKDILFSDRDWREVKQDLSLEPHFHVVALGHHVPGGELTERVYEETGWVFKRITKRENENVSIYDDTDLARVVTYCLSHTAIDTSGEENHWQVRKYGRHLNNAGDIDIQVLPEKERRMSTIVRKVVPKTLGVPMSTQLCTEHTVDRPDSEYQAPETSRSMHSIAMSASSSGAERSEEASHPLDLGPAGELPDAAGVDGDGDPPPESVERSECEGRMLPITQADDYLEDDDWCEQAENVDDLQTTLDQWADRLEELPGG